MSIKIEIDAHPDRGDMHEQIEQAMSALGYYKPDIHRMVSTEEQFRAPSSADQFDRREAEAAEREKAEYGIDYAKIAESLETSATEATAEQYAAAGPAPEETQPQRERGKPAPGRKRRTKEEIAEDEAFEKRWEENEAKQDAEQAAISSGENRVGPEDEPEDAEQDTADEAAEAAASKADGPTLDDIRIAVSRYTAKYGNVATFSDMTKIVGGPIVDVKPEDIEAVVKKIDEAVATDPYDRGGMPDETPVEPATVEDEAPHATKDDVIEAMKKYLVIADGPKANPADLSTMPNATEDFAKLFTMIFGAGITKLGHIPPKPENYGKVLAGINEMCLKDPFKRKGG